MSFRFWSSRYRARALCALAIVFSAVTVAVPAGSQASPSAYASIWRMGFTGTVFGTFNPYTYGSYAGYYAMHLLYPTLVGLDRHGKVVGDLASSWSVSKNQKTWTFKLRSGGWSDGKPITAADAVWTIRNARMHEAANDKFASSVPVVYTANIASARALGAHTLVVRLKKPTFEMPGSLVEFIIMPKHIFSVGGGTVDALSKIATGRSPVVGGGPYSLTKFDGTAALFTANQHFWGGRVATRQLGIRNYATDDALVLALRSNEIDIAPAFAGPAKAADLPSSVKIVTGPNTANFHFLVNLNDSSHPELRSPVVRRALSLAVSRSQIAKLAYAGLAVPESSIVFSAVTPWHNKKLKPDPYAPATANRLLDQAGFSRGSDGIRVANGRRMSYDVLLASAGATNAQARTLIVQYARAIGIRLQEKTVDAATMTALQRAHDWSLILEVGYGGANGLFWLQGFTSTPQSQELDTGFRSKKYDALYAQLQKPGVTAAKAKRLIDQMQAIVASSRPMIPIVSPVTVALVRKNVVGVYAWVFGAPNPRDVPSWAKIRVKR